MEKYIKGLKKYMEELSKKEGCGEACNLLDYIIVGYLEDNPVSSRRIKEIEAEMAPYYENVSFDTSEKLFRFVYDLCGNYEKAAFREGVLVGLRLQKEMERLYRM